MNIFIYIAVLILIILVIVFSVVKYIKTEKFNMLAIAGILSVFLVFSLFTYNGAMRLTLVSHGKPFSAYTTKIKKGIPRDDKYEYFHPTKKIKYKNDEKMEDFVCTKFLLIKYCKYFGEGK